MNRYIIFSSIIASLLLSFHAPAMEVTKTNSLHTAKISHISGWGGAIDPDGDCTFYQSKHSLLIHVPGHGRAHDLAAEIGVTNSPRVVQEVSGDFSVQVEVSGRFEPGTESTLDGRYPYNGAGLIVMADPANVATLARAVFHQAGGQPQHYANIEIRAGGELQRIGLASDHHLGAVAPVYLRLSRKGNTLSGATSLDGVTWDALAPKTLPAWPKKLRVGLVAVSTSPEEFNPRFSNFKISR